MTVSSSNVWDIFCVDKDSKPGALVFNRTVGLKDTWAKQNN